MDSLIINENGREFDAVIPSLIREKWAQSLIDYKYMDIVNGNPKLNSKLTTLEPKNKVHRDNIVKLSVFACYDFAYNQYDINDIYFKRRDEQPFHHLSQDGRELRDIVNNMYNLFFKATPNSEVNSTIKNILSNVREHAELNNGLWYITRDLFWDSTNCELITDYDKLGNRIFRELGCGANLSDSDRLLLKESFDRHKAELQPHLSEEFADFYKDLSMEFDFVKVWAGPEPEEEDSQYVDKYWDIMCAYSTLFMKNKPPVAYLLIGNARGGKSTMVNTLHYIVGNNNSSRTRIVDMADWSINNTLASCMLNAPDEEPAQTPDANAKANFKSIIAHEPTLVRVKNSSAPKLVVSDFISFFPMNSLPNWGSDSDACMKRCRPIMFTNDLSKLDHKPKDFIAETFSPQFTAEFLGAVLALTWFFGQDKTMFYSDTMLSSIDYVSENINSTQLYYRYFKRYCFGFSSFKLLHKDYINFCNIRGYEIEAKEVLKQRFFIENQNRIKYSLKGEKINLYATEKRNIKGLNVISEKIYINNYGPLDEYINDHSGSYVDFLDKEYEKKQEEEQEKIVALKMGWK